MKDHHKKKKKLEMKRKQKYNRASAIRSYGLDNYMIKCKNCKDQYERYGSNGLLHHLRMENNCQQSYTSNEISGLEELEILASRSKKKKRKKEKRFKEN